MRNPVIEHTSTDPHDYVSRSVVSYKITWLVQVAKCHVARLILFVKYFTLKSIFKNIYESKIKMTHSYSGCWRILLLLPHDIFQRLSFKPFMCDSKPYETIMNIKITFLRTWLVSFKLKYFPFIRDVLTFS